MPHFNMGFFTFILSLGTFIGLFKPEIGIELFKSLKGQPENPPSSKD